MALRPSKRQRIAAGIAVAAAVGAGLVSLTMGTATAAALSSITSVSPHVLGVGTADQVITITGKGFSQAAITGVTIDKCATLPPQYIVVSATTLVLKTADTACTAGTGLITITEAGGTATNVLAGTADDLAFSALPTIAVEAVALHSVMTNNTSGLLFADQVVGVPVAGGTAVRVMKGAVAFVNTVAQPLSAKIVGGGALTAITMPVGGAYFTGKLPAHAAGTVTLSVTSNNATATFATGTGAGLQNILYVAGAGISITPSSGPSNGATVIAITGTGFTAGSTVTVGGVAATAVAPSPVGSTTKLVATVPMIAAASSSGPAKVVVTTAGVVTTLSAGSIYTYLAA
jgi:hypothetical protein